MPAVYLELPASDAPAFCTTLENCTRAGAPPELAGAIGKWARFFEALVGTQRACGSAAVNASLSDHLLDEYWRAHTATIDATRRCEGALPSLSRPEQAFGLAWSNLVSFLGPTRFDVSYNQTSTLQGLLPYRVLRAGDVPLRIADMPAATNHAIALVEAMRALNVRSGGKFLAAWECAMGAGAGQGGGGEAGAAARAHARALIEDAALAHPLHDAAQLAAIAYDYAMERAIHRNCSGK